MKFMDSHCHLYGCLTPTDLWERGLSHPPSSERLQWYLSEFKKAYGYTPPWENFWDETKGPEVLASHYAIDPESELSFFQFQARFNLSIALFPLISHEHSCVLDLVLKRDATSSIPGREYRIPWPKWFSQDQRLFYLTQICEKILRAESSSFYPRAIIGLMQEDHGLDQIFEDLKLWKEKNGTLKQALLGLDFCGFEEKTRPHLKTSFVEKTHALDLQACLHVGETWDTLGLDVSLDHIEEALNAGFDRLGHALALGVEGAEFLRSPHTEDEKDSQRLWEQCHAKQEQLLEKAAKHQVQIEVCPTSNVVLGRLSSWKKHPLPRFLRHGIPVLLGTDDPGILRGCTWEEEVRRAESLGLGMSTIHNHLHPLPVHGVVQ